MAETERSFSGRQHHGPRLRSLITAFPVAVGYVGMVMIPPLAIQAVLLTLFTVGYWKGRQIGSPA